MSGSKLDRANLRRQAQRRESYKTLISKQRRTLRTNLPPKRISSVETPEATNFFSTDVEEAQTSRDNHIYSPGSSTPGGSSDSSQDFQPNLCTNPKIQTPPHQSERDISSVMTRSLTRKYASVGAIHNPVDIDKERMVVKQWPSNVAYRVENPQDDLVELKDVVTRAFMEVLKFCKTAVVPEERELQTRPMNNDLWTAESFIDLSPYLNHEPTMDTESDESSVTFQLNEDLMTHPFVNIIALNEEDGQAGTLVIHDEEGEYETVTLHSGETYLVDNQYYFNSSSSEFNSISPKAFNPNASPDDPLMAIRNDHTYAGKPNENVIKNPEPPKKPQTPIIDAEFKLENALNDLLLNTAILKSLVCNETPQEIMCQIDMARRCLYESTGNSLI